MIYNFRFECVAAGICLFLLILLLKNRIIKTRRLQIFGWLMFCVMISSFLDVIAILMLRKPMNYPLWLHYLITNLYQIFFHVITILYYFFMSSLYKKRERKNMAIGFLIHAPYLISLFFDITNCFTKLVFYFDENHIYHQGPLIIYMYLQAWFYIILGFILGMKNKKFFSKDNKFTLLFYVVANALALIFQFFIPDLLLTGFLISISALLTFLCLENPHDYFDPEMDIYNRHAFISIMDSILSKRKKVEILGIKFEEMRYLNDTIGVYYRLELLKNISKFFQETFGKYKIFRISRSHMCVILSNDPLEKEKQISAIQEKFLTPFECGNLKLNLTVYMDKIKCPEDADNIEDILEIIENSFTEVLSNSKLSIVNANTEVIEKQKKENKIVTILEHAIENKKFEILYQPVFSVQNNKYITAEALLRLKDEELGLIKPEEFISVAEKNGMILKIGNYVFKEVCRFISSKKLWEYGIEYVHINLSVVQCMQEKLYEQLFEVMDYYEIPYHYINLDVTEDAANASKDILLDNMEMLQQKNVNFSLDDYGTGFTNAANMINYSFNTIKIDKKLFWNAMKSEKAKIILKQTIQMLKELNMKVVAEGIENKELMELAKDLNCDFIQGYYYSYPLNEKDFMLFMK